MEWTYTTKIMDVKPSTLDEGDDGCIVDAYVEVKVNETKIWCFTPNWRTYFPYSNIRPHHPYGVGETLVKNLIGKITDLTFRFLNLKTELSDERIKAIIPVDPNMPVINYTIIGEIIDKEPFPREPDKFEYLQVDCGFILNNLGADKSEYYVGDYIRSEGRLDVYLVEEEKLIKARRDSVVRGER
ncbi:MAG: hypothetical protein U9N61_03510 [Euryarchaeota archaeon]|nr:hypothetical protein [Euryarchaeota archaeon]